MKKIFLSIIILLFSFWQAFSIWENYAFYSTSQLKEMYKKQDAEVEKLHKRAVKTGFIWYREVFEIKIIFKDFISHKRWIERRTCF